MRDKPFVYGKQQALLALCFAGIFGKFLIGVPRQNYAAAEFFAVNAAGIWGSSKPFYEMDLELPDEDTDRAMYHETKRILEKAGYHRYEISNYARPGRESRHNTGYWKRREYVGFGLGASSQTGRMRYRNCTDLKRYLEGGNHREEESVLTREDEMSETMILGLRMTEGVDLAHFERCFHENALERYAGMIRKFRQAGLLERSGRFLRLTEQGFDVSNLVMCEFLPD